MATTRREIQSYSDTFECAACGATGPTAIFEDIVSGESVCMCCGIVQTSDTLMLECAEAVSDTFTTTRSTTTTTTTTTATATAVIDPAVATTTTATTTATTTDNSLSVDEVMDDVERELRAIRDPTIQPSVTTEDKKTFGCAYRMFDKPFDIIAKRCDLSEGLCNRRATVAMRSACERVAVMHPEFALTHDPGVQVVAAYVVATHPPGVDRGRTRLLKESAEESSELRGICTELGVNMSAVAKCVRNHGDRLYTAMRSARRLGILPDLDPGGHLANAESNRRRTRLSGGGDSLTKTRAGRRTKKSRK